MSDDSPATAVSAATVYRVDSSRCTGCAGCAAVCPEMAIVVDENDRAAIGPGCVSCGACFRFCPITAIIREQR